MRTEIYIIEGMSCAACSAAVERVTRKIDGVESSQVNLITNKMTITYDESKVAPERICAAVEKAGFGIKPDVPAEPEKKGRKSPQRKRRRQCCAHHRRGGAFGNTALYLNGAYDGR